MKLTVAIAVLVSAWMVVVASAKDEDCKAFGEALPLCTVLANANEYDGKDITVRSLHRMVIHGSIFVGPECPKIEVNARGGPGYEADKQALKIARSLTRKDQFRPVDEVNRGIFRVAHNGCFGQICAQYELEVSKFLCAAPAKADISSSDTGGTRTSH